MNYFACQCIFDVLLTSTSKEISELIKSGFLAPNFLVIEKKRTVYICCKDAIVFYYDYHSKHDINQTCGDVIEPTSCFDLISFGFENICSVCEELILKYFLKILVEIKK